MEYFYKIAYDEELWETMGLTVSEFEFISDDYLLLKENEDEVLISNKKGERLKFDRNNEFLKLNEVKSALTSEEVQKIVQLDYLGDQISSIHEVNKTSNITSYSYFDVFDKKRIDFLKEKRFLCSNCRKKRFFM